MLNQVFMQVLDMSRTASVVILVVLLVRLCLKKAPKAVSYALWAVVLFRLLCPLSIKAPVSIVPELTPTAQTYTLADEPISMAGAGAAAYHAVGDALNGGLGIQHIPTTETEEDGSVRYAASNWGDVWILFGQYVWAAGIAAMLLQSAVSYGKIRRKLKATAPLRDNIYLADDIQSPFVIGLLRPKIYLPCGLGEQEQGYIILHEQQHIKRLDHIWKALAYLALCVHWFNPLVWLAFVLAGKDMEMSCDEAVVRRLGGSIRAEYSASLLALATGRRIIAGTPLAFGEGNAKGRIKNLGRWKQPALWVVALALVGAVCAGVALATDPADSPLIDPDSVTSAVMVYSSSYTVTAEGRLVSTPEDRRKDLESADARVLSQEDWAGLVSLINSYNRTVYGHGGLALDGKDHCLVRISCADGSWYLLDYWYWNGFSFNPLHFGEDPYTTLVTYYDAEGNAGTTWQMEYGFDRAFRDDWRSPVMQRQEGQPSSSLGLSIAEGESGPYVRIDGHVGDVELAWGATWEPEAVWGEHPYGELSMVYPGFAQGPGNHIIAWWADEGRTSVTVSTQMTAMLMSYTPNGYWVFTVDLAKDGGMVVEMIPVINAYAQGQEGAETAMYPESITDEEAVKAARVAAELLKAAEEFYAAYQAGGPAQSGFTPAYSLAGGDGSGDVLISGLGGAHVEWSWDNSASKGHLYFAGDPAFCCPRLAGRPVEGSAVWTTEARTALSVVMNIGGERVVSGTADGFYAHFIVELDGGAVGKREFESLVEGEALELTDAEMVEMARTLAGLLKTAEEFYAEAQPPASFPPIEMNPGYQRDDLGTQVVITGLDCEWASWYPRPVDAAYYVPEKALGHLEIIEPRFLGEAFNRVYNGLDAQYSPEDNPDQLWLHLYPRDSGSEPANCWVNLATGAVTDHEIPGYETAAAAVSGSDMAAAAHALAALIEGAARYYDASAPAPEEGPLPFDTPMKLWFGSGAGAWRTILTLHPDGSFEGDYSDADMNIRYVCRFHGRFGDIRKATAASYTMTLEELVLDTGRPVGEEWDADGFHYISSEPYGFDGGDGRALEPGAQFVFYTPEASGRRGGELYGMENEDSGLYRFWTWWPDRYAISGGRGGTLDCYALRSVETGCGFFDLEAWGLL